VMDAVSEDEWSRLSVDEVVELLSCDELNVPDERSVLDAALTWLNHVDVDDDDACRRPLHAARVLAAVKLPLLSPQVSFRCAYAKTKGSGVTRNSGGPWTKYRVGPLHPLPPYLPLPSLSLPSPPFPPTPL